MTTIREPRAIEASYVAFNRKLWLEAVQIIEQGIEPILSRWEYGDSIDQTPLRDGSYADAITDLFLETAFAGIARKLEDLVTSPRVKRFIQRIGQKIDRQITINLTSAFGIRSPFIDTRIATEIDRWVAFNVGLIETGILARNEDIRLRPSLLADVVTTIKESRGKALRVEQLRELIQDRFDVSRSRASLIARDQTLKLNSQINQRRQTAAGVSRYRWSTSKDSRVRDSHRKLEGTVHSWSEPPLVDRGRRAHPGEDFQCRCVAIPIIPGV